MPETTIKLYVDPHLGEWSRSFGIACNESGVEFSQLKGHVVNNRIEIEVSYETPEQLYQLGVVYTREVRKERDLYVYKVEQEWRLTTLFIRKSQVERFKINIACAGVILELVDLQQLEYGDYKAIVKYLDASEIFHLGHHYGRDEIIDEISDAIGGIKWNRDYGYNKRKGKAQ